MKHQRTRFVIVLALLSWSLVFLSSCLSTHTFPKIRKNEFEDRSVIIFVPGYYGTALADPRSGEIFHITLPKALFGGPPLALNADRLDIPEAVTAKPTDVIQRFTIVPGVYAIEPHGNLIGHLMKALPAAQVIAFPYDWRDSEVKSAQALAAVVDEIRQAGARKVAVVGFSNGGVVASYYLRYGRQGSSHAVEDWSGAKALDSIVFIGTPFGGTMRSFYNMQNGVVLGLAATPLSAIAMSSFPSIYELMPPPDAFINSNDNPLGERMYLSKHWIKHQWGLFQSECQLPRITLRKREDYLNERLLSGRQFSEKIRAKSRYPLNPRVPALVVIGKGQETLSKAQWSKKTFDEQGEWIFEGDALFADGDSTVTYESALPPDAFVGSMNIQKLEVEAVHSDLVSNPLVLRKITSFLTERGF